MRGGYQIVDCRGYDMANQQRHKIPGTYEAIEGNYYKPLMVSGVVIDGKEQAAVYANAYLDPDYQTYYSFAVYGGILRVSSEDVVYLTPNS